MDTTLQVLSVLASPVFGLLGVWLGGHLQAKKDDERWQRELTREDERWRRDDRRKWLDEKYRLYSELMSVMSAAWQANRMAYDPHPAYAGGREEPGELQRRRAAAKETMALLGPAVRSIALMGDARINRLAAQLQTSLILTVVAAQKDDMQALMRYSSRAQRQHKQLRRSIREELGVDEPSTLPPYTDREGQEPDQPE